jgi:uncharacterized damage-inducible protein DinB
MHMTTRTLLLGSTLLAALACGQLAFAQAPAAAPAAPAAAAANPNHGPIMTTLKAQWVAVRDKVIPICDIIPEDKLDYKPTPEVRSFKDLIIHITGEGYTFLGRAGSVPGVTPPTMAELNALKTKAELMKALRDSFEWQGKLIDSLTDATASEMAAGRGGAPGTTPKWGSIVGLIADNMDHFGNLVTMVRINGMVPPNTAAAAARRGGGGGARGGAPGAAPATAPARGQ